jgi:hypothetical protein
MLANAILDSIPPSPSVVATGAGASPDLTAVGSAIGLQIGSVVVTPVAAAGKTVVAIDDAGHTITLSGNAGFTGAMTVTFTPPSNPLLIDVGLFSAVDSLTVDTVYADLTQMTYPGYALQAATLGAIRSDAQGDIILPLGTSTWQPTGVVDPEQVAVGFFVVIHGTNQLLFAEMLTTAKSFAGPLDALDVVDEIYIPADTVWGGVCATCA